MVVTHFHVNFFYFRVCIFINDVRLLIVLVHVICDFLNSLVFVLDQFAN